MSQNDVIRKRSKVPQTDDELRRPSRRKTATVKDGTQGLKMSFLSLIICVILILFVVGLYMDTMSPYVERLVSKLGYERPQYAVIIDAGSTGSRALAYKFHKSYIDNKLHLDDELFEEVKPGLSAFADKPAKGAEKIKFLIDQAKRFVPKDKWHTTPILLKATAGLRLLQGHKAEGILNAIRHVFEKCEFFVDANSIEIMNGIDEGIFSWFTVNLLLGRLSKSSQVAALDLGGGSTQVTFSPADPDQVPVYKDYVKTVHSLDRDINVFTHSYLGLGLMAVRHAVFTNGLPKNQLNIESNCVNTIVQNKTWYYGNIEYQISGKDNDKSTFQNPVVDFESCASSIKKIIMPMVKPKPITLKQHNVAAFSYYYDRAIESGLVDITGGEIKIETFRNGAEEACRVANVDQPFMCFDLTYITILLKDGFGLQDHKKVKLYKYINNHEVSWALGCAYNYLTTNDKFNL